MQLYWTKWLIFLNTTSAKFDWCEVKMADVMSFNIGHFGWCEREKFCKPCCSGPWLSSLPCPGGQREDLEEPLFGGRQGWRHVNQELRHLPRVIIHGVHPSMAEVWWVDFVCALGIQWLQAQWDQIRQDPCEILFGFYPRSLTGSHERYKHWPEFRSQKLLWWQQWGCQVCLVRFEGDGTVRHQQHYSYQADTWWRRNIVEFSPWGEAGGGWQCHVGLYFPRDRLEAHDPLSQWGLGSPVRTSDTFPGHTPQRAPHLQLGHIETLHLWWIVILRIWCSSHWDCMLVRSRYCSCKTSGIEWSLCRVDTNLWIGM